MSPFSPEHHTLAGARLRPLEAADCLPLAESLAGLDPWARLGYGAPALAAYLGREDPALSRFVIERGEDGTAGVLALRSPWLRGPYLELFAILPAHQGHGLGRTVMDWSAARAARAAPNLWACVSDFNTAARNFYAANGFAEVAPLDDLVTPGNTEILLRRRLERHAPNLAQAAPGEGQ